MGRTATATTTTTGTSTKPGAVALKSKKDWLLTRGEMKRLAMRGASRSDLIRPHLGIPEPVHIRPLTKKQQQAAAKEHVLRIRKDLHPVVENMLRALGKLVINTAVCYVDHSRRITLRGEHIKRAASDILGFRIYGNPE